MAITPTSLVLLLLCALSLSGFDLLRKLLSGHLAPLPMVFALASAAVPVFWMAHGFEPTVPSRGYVLPAISSVVLNLVAHLAFIHAIRIAPLSMTVPLLSLTPVFVTLVAAGLLGEWPGWLGWCGILLVVWGAFLLHRRPDLGTEGAALGGQDRRRVRRGAGWMVVTALCWSLTLPLDKMAVQSSSMPFHGLVLCAGIACGAFLLLLARRRVRDLAQIRRAPWLFFFTLLASTLALAFQLLALERVLAGVLETFKRGVGNVLAVVLGRVFLGETVEPTKLVAVGVMATGVALLLL